MDDGEVAGSNPDRMKEDTLNGMDPLRNSGDIGSTSRMDEELDNGYGNINQPESRGSVLDSRNGFDKYMGSEGHGNKTGSSNSMYGSLKGNSNAGSKSSLNKPDTYGSKKMNSGKTGSVDRIKKQALKNEMKGSDD